MPEVTREQILSANPLAKHLASIPVVMRGSGNQKLATRCPKVAHKKDHWCVSIDLTQQIWHCNDCGDGGTIIDWIAIESGRDPKVVYKELAGNVKNQDASNQSAQTRKMVRAYDYTNEMGETVYQVCRFEPKDFRQRRPDGKGGWIWDLSGVTRYPYRLPSVMLSREIIIVEGEKDADNLSALGFESTCNVGGAGKWLDAYSEFLRGKDVVIIPDNDEPGIKHSQAIVKSLDKAGSVKVVMLPKPCKDASDFIATFSDPQTAAKALREIIERTPHCLKPVPIYSMVELEAHYIRSLQRSETHSLDFSRIFPSFRHCARPLIPGELVVFMSDTGVGKTAILQTIAHKCAPLSTLFFELELPGELLLERFVQISSGQTGKQIEEAYRNSRSGSWLKELQHILVCSQSGLSVEQIEEYIERSELRFGSKPALVLVDYIGLLRAPGSRGRYEAMSNVAESLRIIAKQSNVILVLAVQISRPDKKSASLEVRLHDAKDSGSIENSASLVIGAWRPDEATLLLRVLKNTKGKSGSTIECNFDGALMLITERANPRYAHNTP